MDYLSICIIGNHISRYGHTPQICETLAKLFSENKINVIIGGRFKNKIFRICDMFFTLVFKRKQYNIVLIDTFSGYGFFWALLSAYLCRLLSKPYIANLMGGNLPVFSSKHKQIVSFYLSGASAIASPSSFLQDWCHRLKFTAQIIPNPIDLSQYTYKAPFRMGRRLLWIRRFHSIYNPAMAINVLNLLLKKDPSYTLTMAGPDSGELGKCRSLAKSLGISRSVKFPGLISKYEINNLGQNHDVFINTTNFDNTPFTLVEAAAMGLPIVTTNVGGIPDLFKHEASCLMVEPGNQAAMSKAIIHVTTNNTTAEKLSLNARNVILEFSTKNVLEKWSKLFTEIMKAL
jgi:glycosyltransferase involved in cell wall biosynthesis